MLMLVKQLRDTERQQKQAQEVPFKGIKRQTRTPGLSTSLQVDLSYQKKKPWFPLPPFYPADPLRSRTRWKLLLGYKGRIKRNDSMDVSINFMGTSEAQDNRSFTKYSAMEA